MAKRGSADLECENQAGKPSCPFHALEIQDLSYNDYLKINDLLNLQVSQSFPAHHEELLFIIIHQAYELWFKLILHEMEAVIQFLNRQEVLRAHHFMNRIIKIMQLLVQQIHILETMAPAEFLEFREQLKPASGFQSTQFREIEFLAGLKDERYLNYFENRPQFKNQLIKRLQSQNLRQAYYELLIKKGLNLPKNADDLEARGSDQDRQTVTLGIRPIYQEKNKSTDLYLLSEALIEFDEYLSLWREHHVRVVERIIGHKQGTGGSLGVDYLKSTTVRKCFPCLWEVRSYLN